MAPFNGDLSLLSFRLLEDYAQISVNCGHRIFALEVVEAKSEPSSVTMMLELNEVDATTEPVSSCREQTMDIEGLRDYWDMYTPCSIL